MSEIKELKKKIQELEQRIRVLESTKTYTESIPPISPRIVNGVLIPNVRS